MKRVEKFGVFVELEARGKSGGGKKITGLAHVSELADGFVEDVGKLFPVGQGTNKFGVWVWR